MHIFIKDVFNMAAALLVIFMAITAIASLLAGIWTAITYTKADTYGAMIFAAIVLALVVIKRYNIIKE